ncbi:MepB family protein [Flavobacterium sp. RHBU_3]|uniref:MepB family protein n=1 Tax=Flavobacterium sp. RHBU_3 TaxID=3391184 RepID=UPI0039851F88
MESDFSVELHIFRSVGVNITNIVPEKESAAYSACQFSTADNAVMLFRKSKITPTKNGQFVTLWKREGNGLIAPFGEEDNIRTIIIRVENNAQSGYFIFPASVLCNQKIFTANGKEGKRAFRVYPPWDKPESKQAAATQKWQLQYFVEIKEGSLCDVKKAVGLFYD